MNQEIRLLASFIFLPIFFGVSGGIVTHISSVQAGRALIWMVIILWKYGLVAEKWTNRRYISFIKEISETFGSVITQE